MSDHDAGPLRRLGGIIQRRRRQAGLSRPELSKASGLSVRFLAKVEGGTGNISYLRLRRLAQALDTDLTTLVDEAESAAPRVVSLLGLRGAGKSTVGKVLSENLGLPLVELDKLVESEAGMELGQIFELQGEGYFRRVERTVLRRFLSGNTPAVLATSGGIVNDPEAFGTLKRETISVWLKATPRDHWTRVLSQGDKRPMEGYDNAMAELENLWKDREPLYSRCTHVVDTSGRDAEDVARTIQEALDAHGDS